MRPSSQRVKRRRWRRNLIHLNVTESGFSTPGLETETPKLLSKLFLPGENVTTRKKTLLKPSASVKAATYDGQSAWRDYRAHFETCAEINQWDYNDRGLYLAVSLRGQAQGVFGNLAQNSSDYNSLLQALEERFAPLTKRNCTECSYAIADRKHRRPWESWGKTFAD
ncbi:hypothetical protein DPMN_065363 [Dreissena polymorpha]|uniref:Uncharacterized protein n=1 Tax=Dreissena polymorpha TaxID=45954 RepID=A0A9D4HK95_DREPO|nr:hypothetical protein DPMN_065363 [Dreissena polymorpha]